MRSACEWTDAEVLLVFLVRETRKAKHSRRIGRCGIAIEFARQGVEECFGLL